LIKNMAGCARRTDGKNGADVEKVAATIEAAGRYLAPGAAVHRDGRPVGGEAGACGHPVG
jgi:hypothetical protein